jgi:purine-nucleoside phosphorylase
MMPPDRDAAQQGEAMKEYKRIVEETADFLKGRIDRAPEIGMVTGTGLGEAAEWFDISGSLEYRDIPHFPVSTVESHRGRLLFGGLKEKPIIAMQGRFHLYEGYSPLEITFPIRVMKRLGVETLILSNASGGLHPGLNPGDIMALTDHINLTGSNPLTGPNEDTWGIRFPDMGNAYDKDLLDLIEKEGRSREIRVKKGIYAGLAGPSLETPAEARFLRRIGADAVGFSTVQETISAIHSGMRVLGLSIITNIHDPDDPAPASAEEIIAMAKKTVPQMGLLIKSIVKEV